MRHPLIWLGRLKSTKCTSPPGRKAASATGVALAWPVHARAWFVQRRQATRIHPRRPRYWTAVRDPGESRRRIDDTFDREYVVHSDGEYADDEVYVKTRESHRRVSDAWLSPHRGVSKDKLTQYLRAFQLRQELYRKPGRDALKHAVQATL